MPFKDKTAFNFDQQTLNRVRVVGGVYGLAQAQLLRPGWYNVLYVGKTGNLRERLQFWLNTPPVAGITHFFADVLTNTAERDNVEAALIAEFKPIGNTLLK